MIDVCLDLCLWYSSAPWGWRRVVGVGSVDLDPREKLVMEVPIWWGGGGGSALNRVPPQKICPKS